MDALQERALSQVDAPAAGVDAHAQAAVDEGEALEFAHDIAELDIVRLEEFAASRDIEEEIGDRDGSAGLADVGRLTLYA